MRFSIIVASTFALCPATAHAQWVRQTIRTDAGFRGLSVVSPTVAWVGGTKGAVGRTTDGGRTWSLLTVPDADKLDFRDVEAFSDDVAYLLSAGPGPDSRIYKTTDGGKTFALQFKNADPDGFFDALAFWDDKNGLALGDPVKGRFQLIATDDGGATWKPLPADDLPAALPKEGCFAASGTCLIAHGARDAWFCTGGAKAARVFHSTDRGRTWTVADTPVAAGVESAGGFSLAFRDAQHGILVGGDYRKPNAAGATVAVTADGGKTWTAADKSLPFCSAVVWTKGRWIAVGASGSHVSEDDGKTWKRLDNENYNSVAVATDSSAWAAGPKGRIVHLTN